MKLVDQYFQITEAIRRYGISDSTTSLLVVRIDAGAVPTEEMEARMKRVVDGELIPLSHLEEVTDWSTIKKVRITTHHPEYLLILGCIVPEAR